MVSRFIDIRRVMARGGDEFSAIDERRVVSPLVRVSYFNRLCWKTFPSSLRLIGKLAFRTQSPRKFNASWKRILCDFHLDLAWSRSRAQARIQEMQRWSLPGHPKARRPPGSLAPPVNWGRTRVAATRLRLLFSNRFWPGQHLLRSSP